MLSNLRSYRLQYSQIWLMVTSEAWSLSMHICERSECLNSCDDSNSKLSDHNLPAERATTLFLLRHAQPWANSFLLVCLTARQEQIREEESILWRCSGAQDHVSGSWEIQRSSERHNFSIMDELLGCLFTRSFVNRFTDWTVKHSSSSGEDVQEAGKTERSSMQMWISGKKWVYRWLPLNPNRDYSKWIILEIINCIYHGLNCKLIWKLFCSDKAGATCKLTQAHIFHGLIFVEQLKFVQSQGEWKSCLSN